jgi:hypothetical protein
MPCSPQSEVEKKKKRIKRLEKKGKNCRNKKKKLGEDKMSIMITSSTTWQRNKKK